MNINDSLLIKTRCDLYKYDCRESEIKPFLRNREDLLERQQKAIKIIEKIMTAHGKQELLKYVSELARVEHGIRELQPWVRDHVVHALLSFILGIYINEKFLGLISKIQVNEFQWKLAGLFHDVGYPAEIANNVLKPFTDKVNEIKEDFGVNRPDIISKIDPGKFENLQNNINSFDLIQQNLKKWGLQINARKEYNQIIESGRIDHGMISSLAVLYVIDIMYEKYNPKREYRDKYVPGTNINCNQIYFEDDVVPACSAIYIHNLPKSCFLSSKIDRLKAPVAFLLKLSDCLQQWERPSKTNQIGFSSNNFDIEIRDGQILFYTNISNEKKKEIKDEISSCLFAPDIIIS